MLLEEAQLRDRRTKLVDFMQTLGWHTLPIEERRRMKRQLRVMTLYRDVLLERIEAAGAEPLAGRDEMARRVEDAVVELLL